jgi:hypothetical protein
MGGGDLSLGKLLEEVPDLTTSLEDAGVHPVASIPCRRVSMIWACWPAMRRRASSPGPQP